MTQPDIMSPEPITAERTYQKLKQNVAIGRYKPGSILNLQRLADEFGTSVTPLRDAIHRLVGERLIEVHQGGGFELPVPTAETLRHLYTWHDHLIRHAFRHPLPSDVLPLLATSDTLDNSPKQFADATSNFFAAAAASADNPEVHNAVASVSDRLLLARLAEPKVIKSTAAELHSLVAVATRGPAAAIRAAVRDYHRRRQRRVDRLVVAIMT